MITVNTDKHSEAQSNHRVDYSTIKNIDPKTLANKTKKQKNKEETAVDYAHLGEFANAIGGYSDGTSNIQRDAISYMARLVNDIPDHHSDRYKRYPQALTERSKRYNYFDDGSQGHDNNFSRSHQHGAMSQNPNRQYIAEIYELPAQQYRRATKEDVEKLRKSMDESTSHLTPKQMAFWERFSAYKKEKTKGTSPPPLNPSQVLVKYESVQPEQSVYFDPSKSINLMVPENEGSILY